MKATKCYARSAPLLQLQLMPIEVKTYCPILHLSQSVAPANDEAAISVLHG